MLRRMVTRRRLRRDLAELSAQIVHVAGDVRRLDLHLSRASDDVADMIRALEPANARPAQRR